MSKVSINAADLRALYKQAKRIDTVNNFVDLCLEWADAAEKLVRKNWELEQALTRMLGAELQEWANIEKPLLIQAGRNARAKGSNMLVDCTICAGTGKIDADMRCPSCSDGKWHLTKDMRHKYKYAMPTKEWLDKHMKLFGKT